MHRDNRIVLVTGQKGTGKTYLAQKIARSLLDHGRRLFVLSPHNDINIPGLMLVRSVSGFKRIAGHSVLCLPDDDEVASAFFSFVSYLQENSRAAPLWLLVDELSMFLDVRRPFDAFLHLVRYGRNKGISMIGTVQRVAQVHNDFIANADYKILFRVQEVNDLAYLKRYVGDIAARLPSLPDRKYISVGLPRSSGHAQS